MLQGFSYVDNNVSRGNVFFSFLLPFVQNVALIKKPLNAKKVQILKYHKGTIVYALYA